MRLIADTVCGAANVNKRKDTTHPQGWRWPITKVLPGTGRTDRRTECNAICGTLLRRRAPHNNRVRPTCLFFSDLTISLAILCLRQRYNICDNVKQKRPLQTRRQHGLPYTRPILFLVCTQWDNCYAVWSCLFSHVLFIYFIYYVFVHTQYNKQLARIKRKIIQPHKRMKKHKVHTYSLADSGVTGISRTHEVLYIFIYLSIYLFMT